MSQSVGYSHAVLIYTKGTCTIHRWVGRYAYARNGNAHNPTPSYRYTVFCNGKNVGSTSKLKDAKALIADCQ